MVGLGYGFVSGATAGGIGLYWRLADYGRVAGRTYIAWCLAAVSLPVLAGTLFDMTHRYDTAVLIAAGATVALAHRLVGDTVGPLSGKGPPYVTDMDISVKSGAI
jgi:hypothetical protein